MDNQNILSKVQDIRKKIRIGMKELNKVKPAELREEIENFMFLSKSVASKLIVHNSILDAFLIQMKLNESKRIKDNFEERILDTISKI